MVASPTFILEAQYPFKSDVESNSTSGMLYHWDLYRLRNSAQCLDEVPQDLLDRRRDADALVCVEWPEQIPSVLDLLDIRLMLAFCEEGQQLDLHDDNSSSPRKIDIYAAAASESGLPDIESITNSFLQTVPSSLISKG